MYAAVTGEVSDISKVASKRGSRFGWCKLLMKAISSLTNLTFSGSLRSIWQDIGHSVAQDSSNALIRDLTLTHSEKICTFYIC